MTERTEQLERSLEEVPRLLLDEEDRAVLTDALTSVSILADIEREPNVIAFVGPSGSGRSYVFNLVVGAQVSTEGVLRPTTTGIVAASVEHQSYRDLQGEFVSVPTLPPGMLFLDTPSWEHDPQTVAAVISAVDLVILVVSPGRYADASVNDLWREIREAGARVVLNRMPTGELDREALIDSVRSVFDVDPIVLEDGVGDPSALLVVLDDTTHWRADNARRNIMAHSGASGAIFIAGAVTNNAWQIEAVRASVEAAPLPAADWEPLTVRDSWLATKQSMVETVARRIRDSEDDVVRSSGAPLGDRIRSELGPWVESTLDADLDAWQTRCVDLHVEAASMRWRRKSGRQLLERLSWRSAINEDIVNSKRFVKIMGKEFPRVAAEARDEFRVLLEGSIEERRVAWLNVLADLGEYQPGVLAASAEALENEYRTDG